MDTTEESNGYERDFVDEAEDALRKIESSLEKVGRDICPKEGSGVSRGHIDRAIEEVQEAIHNCFRMRISGDAT